jgi:hypothetical protein
MKRLLVAALSLGLISVTFPDAGWTQTQKCPPELAQAQAALQKAQQALKQQQARAKRAQAGAKSQEVQAPRGQEVQAPRGQEIQAPKVAKARALVQQADQACTKGDMTLSAQKAKEALELLK